MGAELAATASSSLPTTTATMASHEEMRDIRSIMNPFTNAYGVESTVSIPDVLGDPSRTSPNSENIACARHCSTGHAFSRRGCIAFKRSEENFLRCQLQSTSSFLLQFIYLDDSISRAEKKGRRRSVQVRVGRIAWPLRIIGANEADDPHPSRS